MKFQNKTETSNRKLQYQVKISNSQGHGSPSLTVSATGTIGTALLKKYVREPMIYILQLMVYWPSPKLIPCSFLPFMKIFESEFLI